jgi:hypothetical protein
MNKQVNNFEYCCFNDEWGQFADIEANYPIYISGPFPFSTSKTKKNPIPIPMPATMSSRFKNYNYDIEANYPEEKKEYNKITEKNINLKGLESNINISTCITVSIITYVLLFIV